MIFDCIVDKHENCFPMIPSGKAHNEMLLNDYLGETGVELPFGGDGSHNLFNSGALRYAVVGVYSGLGFPRVATFRDGEGPKM